jgi:hypothetical protein
MIALNRIILLFEGIKEILVPKMNLWLESFVYFVNAIGEGRIHKRL